MINTVELPSQSYLKSILHYNPLTGSLIWKERTVEMFKNSNSKTADWSMRRWNTRHAGREAMVTISRGYKVGRINDRPFKSHRIIWKLVYGADPDQIDHINHDRQDNRLTNLREVTNTGNQKNKRVQINNKSGVVGVFWSKTSKKWAAGIKVNGRNVHLGFFKELDDARLARERANIKYEFHFNHGRS